MKTITYRHESVAARALAKKYGLHYQGRQRLNTVHVGDEPEELAKAMATLDEIREESDYFCGQIEWKNEAGDLFRRPLPSQEEAGQPLGNVLAQAQRDLGGRIKIN